MLVIQERQSVDVGRSWTPEGSAVAAVCCCCRTARFNGMSGAPTGQSAYWYRPALQVPWVRTAHLRIKSLLLCSRLAAGRLTRESLTSRCLGSITDRPGTVPVSGVTGRGRARSRKRKRAAQG
jgi:hypothetical protein